MVQPDMPHVTNQYGACVSHAVYLRLQTHTQNKFNLLLSHSNSDYANGPQYAVIRTLPVCFLSSLEKLCMYLPGHSHVFQYELYV